MATLSSDFSSEFIPTSDQWYVTNGQDVVGPVGIGLVLRGIAHGKIPDDCFVRQAAWTSWRPLDRVREIAALKRTHEVAEEPAQAPRMTPYFETIRLLAHASDLGEAMLLAMDSAVRATGASAALLHSAKPPQPGLVTSCVYGPGAEIALGAIVSREDPVFFAAQLGVRIARSGGVSHTQARTAARLRRIDPDITHVAMYPVRTHEKLTAVLELGRAEHEFRRDDLTVVQEVVDALRDAFERPRHLRVVKALRREHGSGSAPLVPETRRTVIVDRDERIRCAPPALRVSRENRCRFLARCGRCHSGEAGGPRVA